MASFSFASCLKKYLLFIGFCTSRQAVHLFQVKNLHKGLLGSSVLLMGFFSFDVKVWQHYSESKWQQEIKDSWKTSFKFTPVNITNMKVFFLLAKDDKISFTPATLLGTPCLYWLGLFCLQNCLNSSWCRFNKENKDFGPCWHDSITQNIHDLNLLLHHTQSGECGGHLNAVMFKKTAWDDLNFVTWCVILLQQPSEGGYTVVIKGWTWSATIIR